MSSRLFNDRYILFVQCPTSALPPLSDIIRLCQGGLNDDLENIRRHTGLRCHTFNILRSNSVSDKENLSFPAHHLRSSPPGLIRIAISPRSVEFNGLEADEIKPINFSIAYRSKELKGWEVPASDWVHSYVGLPDEKVASFVADILFDMSIANSECLADVLKPAIETLSYKGLYRAKVDFAREQNYSAYHGPVRSNSRYISFASLSRGHEAGLYKRVIRLWDEFAFDKLSDFIPSRATALQNLRKRKYVGGQLNLDKVESQLSAFPMAGAYVLALSGFKPNRHLDRRRVIDFLGSGADEWRGGKMKLFSANDLPSSFYEFVHREQIKPIRFYVARAEESDDHE